MRFKIVDQYIFKVIFPNFVLGVIIFSIVNLIQYLYEFISLSIEKDIPVTKVFTLLFYIIPFLMTFTIPVGVLIGILLAMGELSSNNEIIAMRANGVRFFDIFKSAISFGILVAVFHILFFQFILPWGNKNYVMAKYDILRKNPTFEIANKKNFSEGEIEIRVEKVDLKKQIFYGIRIVNFKENLIFLADEGYFEKKDEKLNAFPLMLKRVAAFPYVFKKAEQNIQQQFYQEMRFFIKDFDIQKFIPRGAELDGIVEVIKDIKKTELINIHSEMRNFHNFVRKNHELFQKQQKLMTLTDPNEVKRESDQLQIISLESKNQEKQVYELRKNITPKNDIYILHRKFSYAVSAILMAILAVPLGMVHRRRGKEIAFGIGVLVVVVYNALLIAGNFGWKLGYVSPLIGAWFPNIIIASCIIIITYWKMRKV